MSAQSTPAATSRPIGLTGQEAAARLARDGPNALPPPHRTHPLVVFARQLVHFFALMLWLALVAGKPALGMAIAVLLNGGFSFAQAYCPDRAAERAA